jgi:hypothetical protein
MSRKNKERCQGTGESTVNSSADAEAILLMESATVLLPAEADPWPSLS